MSLNELTELALLGKTLDAESSNLDATISALNEEISSLNLRCDVWLESEILDTEIGFAEAGTRGSRSRTWQLAVREKDYDDENEPTGQWCDAVPLLKASRDLRIETLGNVPAILACLKASAQDKLRVMREAKKLVASLSADRTAVLT